LSAISWSIQASIPLSEMPAPYQQTVHQLIPEYERGLQSDFLQNLRNSYGRIPNMPSFDSQLGRMGSAGAQIASIERSRAIIRANALDYQRLNQTLYAGPPGQEIYVPAHPIASPWFEIRPGVSAQLTIEHGHLGLNRLRFRVTPAALQKKKKSRRSASVGLNAPSDMFGWASPSSGAPQPFEPPANEDGISLGDIVAPEIADPDAPALMANPQAPTQALQIVPAPRGAR
jgi:hypothetical protein